MRTSLVMAVYNGEKYLPTQLESIRNQTRTLEEVIIVDDCSSDNTVHLVKEYMEKYQLDHWKLYINEENLGFKRNFHLAISLAKNELVFLCDQDDIWNLHKVEFMEKIIDENEEILLLASSFSFIDNVGNAFCIKEDQNKSNQNLLRIKVKEREVIMIPFKQVIKENFAQGCCMCMRDTLVKDYLQQVDTTLPHDWSLVLLAAAQNRCYFYNQSLIQYRIHGENTIGLESYITGQRLQSRKYRLNNRELVLKQEVEPLHYLMGYSKIKAANRKQLSQKNKVLQYRVAWIKEKRIIQLAGLFFRNIGEGTYPLNAFAGDLISAIKFLM